MEPPSYMRSVVDRNVVMRRIHVFRLGRLRWKVETRRKSVYGIIATGGYQDT